MGPECVHQAPGQLHRERDRRVGHRHGGPQAPRLLQVPIRLARGDAAVPHQALDRLGERLDVGQHLPRMIEALGFLTRGPNVTELYNPF